MHRFYGSLSILISFLILLLPCLVMGQVSVRVNEHFENEPLAYALEKLEAGYGVKLGYDPITLRGKKVTVQIVEQPLKTAISLLLDDTGMEFRMIEDDEILIRPSEWEGWDDMYGKMRLHGFVYDYQAMQPLVGASIITGPGKGVTSDQDGYFEIQWDSKAMSDSVRVQFVGYKPCTWPVEDLSDRKDHVFYMMPEPTLIDEVEIKERMPITRTSKDGALTMNAKRLNELPSFVGGVDLLRNLQLLPGISASDDLSSDLNIRGGSSEGNLVILDGITLYKTDHYLGIFSIVNPGVAEHVNLYKNDFPIEYGGRTDGVVDISTRKLNGDSFRGGVDLNLLTSTIWTEIPISSRMNIMAAGRITNNDIADTRLFDPLDQNMRDPLLRNNPNNPHAVNRILPLEPDFRFNDLNVKWSWNPAKNTSFQLSYFQSDDELNYSSFQEIRTRFMNMSIENSQQHQERSVWQNRGFSFITDRAWNEKLNTTVLISRSDHNSTNDVSTQFKRVRPQGVDSTSFFNHQENVINSWDLNIKNTWEIDETMKFHGGYQWNILRLQTNINVDDRNVLFQDRMASIHTGYGQYELTEGAWHLRFGSRLSRYELTKDWYLSPRLGVGFQMDMSWRLKASISRNYQFLRELFHEDRYGRTYEFWVLANEQQFPVARADNYMLGFNWTKGKFSADVEMYYKVTDGVLEHAKVLNGVQPPEDNASDASPYRVFNGVAYSRGIDILLKKSGEHHTGWLSYTLSKTTNEFPEINNGASFPGQYDRRHQLQFVNQYQRKNWQFSMTYVFASGRPYTDISFLTGLRDRRDMDPLDRLRYLPDYHRVDLGVNYLFDAWGKDARIGLSIFNLLDRKNVKYVQYTFSLDPIDAPHYPAQNTVVGTELDMLGITPNISFSLEW